MTIFIFHYKINIISYRKFEKLEEGITYDPITQTLLFP